MCHILRKLRLVNFSYISIPKTASRSILNWLKLEEKNIAVNNHKSIYNIEETDFSFSFIREPIDRLKSWFYFHNYLYNLYSESNRRYEANDLFIYNTTFNNWCLNGFKHHWTEGMLISSGITNPLNQFEFVCKDGIVDIDFLGNFDKLHNQLIIVSKIIEIPFSGLSKINTSNKQNIELSTEMESEIKQKFYKDFILYNSFNENEILIKNQKIF